jgi:hypothetical protein
MCHKQRLYCSEGRTVNLQKTVGHKLSLLGSSLWSWWYKRNRMIHDFREFKFKIVNINLLPDPSLQPWGDNHSISHATYQPSDHIKTSLPVVKQSQYLQHSTKIPSGSPSTSINFKITLKYNTQYIQIAQRPVWGNISYHNPYILN